MTSLFLTLDSKAAKQTDSRATGSDYTITYNRGGIDLPNPDRNKYRYGVTLHSLKVYNTIPNVSSNYATNTISIKRNDADPYTVITLPDGLYNFDDIDKYIKDFLYSNGWYGGTATNPVFAVSLGINIATSQFVFNFLDPTTTGETGATNYTVRVDEKINVLLGFNANQEIDISDSIQDRSSPNRPEITFGINEIGVNLSIVEDSYVNDQNRQSIEVYTPDVAPGALIQVVPSKKTFLPVFVNNIRNIRVYLTDNLNRPVDLRGEDTVITLELKLLKRY